MTGLEGFLLVNKPAGVTSHDVVEVVRRKLGVRRIGHTGTLDPMAEGLLMLLVGPATKHQHVFQTHEKIYEATVRFGVQTDTGDATGMTVRTAPVPAFDRHRISEVLAAFQGSQAQTPPAYSAVKVRGRPAYWWARRRTPVTLAPRMIHLSEMTLVDCSQETITFRARCSAGTYIRTLAEAIAERLGTVGHVAALVRLHVGPWSLEEAKPLSWISEATPQLLRQQLRPVPAASAKPGTGHAAHGR